MNVLILDRTMIDAIERISKKKDISETDALELVLKNGISSIFIREGLHDIKNVNDKTKWESNTSLSDTNENFDLRG